MTNPVSRAFSKLAQAATIATGNAWAFILALSTILIWGVLGPSFHYSDTWQLVINTSTTIVTFLMVFVIQHAQNKEMRAIQIKLDELIGATHGASNKLIDAEDLSDDEVEELYRRFQDLANKASEQPPGAALSVEEAQELAGRARDAVHVADELVQHVRGRGAKRGARKSKHKA